MTQLRPARWPADAPRGAGLRGAMSDLPPQKIVEVVRDALDDPEVIPLWFGEGDLPTPQFICDAAAASLSRGRTFYTHQRGIPELRQALSDYLTGLHAHPVEMERVTVTTSGMGAILLLVQALLEPGDECVVVEPVWPNFGSAVHVAGARTVPVPLALGQGGWRLDLDALFGACGPSTRMLFVNTPNNPAGWVITPEDIAAILAFARERGIWVVADEVYSRLVYEGRAAPSFLDQASPDDPLIVINSFSKNWAMTGWRIGWMVAPAWTGDLFASLTQFSTSGVATFVQDAATVAVRDGEPFVAEMVARCRAGRDIVFDRLRQVPEIEVPLPQGGFYVFFRVPGIDDSLALAKRIVREARVGLAPGAAFGNSGEGWLRLCFASSPERLAAAMDRLMPHLAR